MVKKEAKVYIRAEKIETGNSVNAPRKIRRAISRFLRQEAAAGIRRLRKKDRRRMAEAFKERGGRR